MENRCVCCGEIIPEGRMVCPNCENREETREKGMKGVLGLSFLFRKEKVYGNSKEL